MLHTKFEQDFGRVSVRQERLELDLPPVESRLPLVVELYEAEVAGEIDEEELETRLEIVLDETGDSLDLEVDADNLAGIGLPKRLVRARFDYQASWPTDDTFAEEDAFFDELNNEEDPDDEISTEVYLTLSTSENACVPISEEDIACSGLHRAGVRGQATTGTLRHALRHDATARVLVSRTGITGGDYEGMSSWAADQAVSIRDQGF